MKFDQLKDNKTWDERENEILRFWEENDIFKRSIEKAENRQPFIFYEGPPTANGKPGIHHVGGRTIKDLMCRYKTMKGFRVDRKAGWDTHGLPVEVEVEKRLNLHSKHDVEKYGVVEFNQQCRESVFTYKSEWDQITHRIGYWLDLDKPYITLENYYIESVWHILANFFNRDLIYEGHKTVPFCPRCETTLSSHEVSQGYMEVADPSVYVKMKSADGDFSYLVWTTTPWTLPSNAAICFHPDETYIRVKFEGEELVLAEALANKVLGDEFEVLDRKKGVEFEGQKYIPLFDTFADYKDNAFYAIHADFVTMEDGTGIVHIAPGFGADDYDMGQKYGLPVLQAIDFTGHFKDDTGWLSGKYIKDADPEIIADLKKRGLLYRSEKYEHNYPFCWRCDTPLIYIARKSWYIRTTQFKDKLIENNKSINWYPPEIGPGRMGEWLENNIDWAISRERFWGTPLPIWICEKCGEKRAVGSIEQLKKEGINVPDDIDLHKPHIDAIELTCPSCSGKMKRIPEVIDVWFDSGAMPFAQWHYPFENKEQVEKEWFPAEFISEAIDQTRGWFYSLLTISTLFFDQPCFKNCIVQEFVVDKDGKKMSKHIGNVIDPFEMVEKYGADSVRWYMMTTSHPWIALKFDSEGVAITQRKFFDTFKNCYAFWALYANIDDVRKRADDENKAVSEFLREKRGELTLIDHWVLSRYNTVVKDVTESLDNYNLTRATRLISDFVIEDLSNWYIRLNRSRFYGKGDDPDKMLVYSLLYDILSGTCALMAPVAPFFSEFVYRQLLGKNHSGRPESVHLTDYPVCDEATIEARLEDEMAFVQKVVSLALAARKRKNLKVRQPLSKIMIHGGDNLQISADVAAIIMRELNIKEYEFLAEAGDFVSYQAKANFGKLGPKFGKDVKKLAETVADLPSEQIKQLAENGRFTIDFDGRQVELTDEEIEVVRSEKSGFAVESDGSVSVVLVTDLTPELVDEGFAREVVNKVQNMRKTSGFEVTDRIKIKLFADGPLSAAINRHEKHICAETLADSLDLISLDSADGDGKEWSINGEKAVIAVIRS